MSIASYPHVKIHVKDNSIYNAIATEILPLHKPLYMMRAQRGKVGVPVWCPAYSTARKEFGEETFNVRNKKYYSNQAYFLLKTFPRNGAFVMRVADTTCTTATLTIEIGVKDAKIKQRLRDTNGRFVTDLDGSTTLINAQGEAVSYQTVDKYVQVPSGSMVEKDVTYYTDGADIYVAGGTTGSGEQLAWKDDGEVFTRSGEEGSYTYTAVNKSTVTKPAAGTTYYVKDGKVKEQMYGLTPGALFPEGVTVYTKETVITGEPENAAEIDGIKICWRARVRTAQEAEEYALDEQKSTTDTNGWKWRTAFNIVADNPGAWGQAFGLKVFYDATANTVADTISMGSVNTTFQPVELVSGDTLPTPIYDAFNQTSINGTMKRTTVDPVTDLDLYLGKLIERCYIGNHQLPIKVYPIAATFGEIGEEVMLKEIAARDAATALYADTYGINTADGEKVQTFVDALFEKTAIGADVATAATITEYDRSDEAFNEELNELNNGNMAIDNMFAGFMVNLFSCKDGNKVPYYAAELLTTDPMTWSGLKVGDEYVTQNMATLGYIKTGSDAAAQGVGIFTPGQDTAVYLAGGNDGNIKDWDIERFIQAHVRAASAGTQEYLIDYARCPFNCFMDTGVGLATKKAYLDMLDVRDSLVVNLSTQVTWHYQKTVGTKKIETVPTLNTRYEDESIGSALRAYAWLMKEDIENGTECCRANIFLHSGKTSDYEGWVPGTLCIAMKWADFYKGQFINQEVRELPNSDIDCFTEVSWAAAAEDTKSRCWNAGLNYWQYYNMTRLHYASVHSVYRHDTSILSDSAVVYAICFCKDECRRSWARWAGSGRRAAELNQKITDDLDGRFKLILNGKYTCDPTVYQTDEDMKRGYSRHVDLRFEAPGQNRVWEVTVECNRENFNPSAE